MPERSVSGVALWALGVLALSILARIGWELGGRIWATL